MYNFFKKSKIRLRLAPSPTGFLHVGNLRGALFAYLLTKKWGGKLILRIEDTDQKREVAGAVDSLLRILAWSGIKFDEGPAIGGKYGPYIQSKRIGIYQKHADILLQSGAAYKCFCSEERLEKLRAEQTENKLAPRYDRACRDLSEEAVAEKIKAGSSFVIRQKMPLEGEVKVFDELRGEIKFPATDLEDQVLVKSNGVPTYQLANVVDDHLMKISHVTRGDEWLPSYPKNILLYQAFGWTAPKFIHLPLILNKEGGKLSKRQGDVFVEDYKNKGYLPETLINFCALLGWHPKTEQEIYTLEELEKAFDLKGLGISPAVFDLDKLDYFNGYYLRQKSIKDLAELCRPYIEGAGKTVDDSTLEKIVILARERLKKLSDIIELSAFILNDEINYDKELLLWKSLGGEEVRVNLATLKTELEKIPETAWGIKDLENIIGVYLKSNNLKVGNYLWPMRVALTGAKNSPSPFEAAFALGKKRALNRLEKAIALWS